MSFHDNLKRLRTQAKVTRKELAQVLDMHPNAYGMYETGTREPNIEKICKIAQVLRVTIDELLEYQPDELDFWMNKWKILPVSIEKVGEKVLIHQSRFPHISPAVFDTKEEFINFSRLAYIRAKEEYNKNLAQKLYDLLIDKILENMDKKETQRAECTT